MNILGLRVEVEDPDGVIGPDSVISEANERIDLPIFRAYDGSHASLNDIFVAEVAAEAYRRYPANASGFEFTAEREFGEDPRRLTLELPEGKFPLARVSGRFNVELQSVGLPLEGPWRYKSEQVDHAITARAHILDHGVPITHGFHEAAGGNREVSITVGESNGDHMVAFILGGMTGGEGRPGRVALDEVSHHPRSESPDHRTAE
jgi:hypothetical protein